MTLLYDWKSKLLRESGPAATTLQQRVHQLDEQLRQVERERDVLKIAEDVREVYNAMDQLQQEGFAAAHLCRVLRVSRSAYYAWRED